MFLRKDFNSNIVKGPGNRRFDPLVRSASWCLGLVAFLFLFGCLNILPSDFNWFGIAPDESNPLITPTPTNGPTDSTSSAGGTPTPTDQNLFAGTPTPTLTTPTDTPTSTPTPGQNAPPTVKEKLLGTPINVACQLNLTGTDVDNDTLTFQVLTSPQHGTLTGSPPALTYTPQTDYTGPDNFTFKANDGKTDSNTGTIWVTTYDPNALPSGWPMMHANAQRTRSTSSIGPETPTIKWQKRGFSGWGTSVVAADNKYYFRFDNNAYNLSSWIEGFDDNGTQLWSTATLGTPLASMAVGPDGMLYTTLPSDLPSWHHYLGYINTQDGSLNTLIDEWPLDYPNSSFILVGQDGSVYLAGEFAHWVSDDSGIHLGGLECSTVGVSHDGNLKWRNNVYRGDLVLGHSDILYLRGPYAINTSDGAKKWEIAGLGDPVLAGRDMILVVGQTPSFDTWLYSFNPIDGTTNWSVELPKKTYVTMLHYALSPEGIFYIWSTDGWNGILAINSYTGTEIWRKKHDVYYYDLPNRYEMMAVDGTGTLYWIGSKSQLIAMKPDETVKWAVSFPSDSRPRIEAIGCDGSIIVGITLFVSGGSDEGDYIRYAIGSGGNQVPVATDQQVITQTGKSVAMTLGAQDGEGDSLTYEIYNSPPNGTLLINNFPNVTYTPNSGFTGTDTFTFRVTDGGLYSNVATVTIQVGQ